MASQTSPFDAVPTEVLRRIVYFLLNHEDDSPNGGDRHQLGLLYTCRAFYNDPEIIPADLSLQFDKPGETFVVRASSLPSSLRGGLRVLKIPYVEVSNLHSDLPTCATEERLLQVVPGSALCEFGGLSTVCMHTNHDMYKIDSPMVLGSPFGPQPSLHFPKSRASYGIWMTLYKETCAQLGSFEKFAHTLAKLLPSVEVLVLEIGFRSETGIEFFSDKSGQDNAQALLLFAKLEAQLEDEDLEAKWVPGRQCIHLSLF